MAAESKSYDAMILFQKQLQRHTAMKIVIAPTSVNERGLVAKLSLLKAAPQSRIPSSRPLVRLRLAIDGSAESHTGLKQAFAAIEEINDYLKRPRNLEDAEGNAIANTRIVQRPSEEDSALDNPDGTAVQDILDERLVILYLSE